MISAPPGFPQQNAADAVPTSKPTSAPSVPQHEWYPFWTGDAPGCLNDGMQPSYMDDEREFFMSTTQVECCEKNFADSVACLGMDYFVDSFKCSGADFNEDTSHLAPNAVLHICIRSKSSDVEIDYLNSMVRVLDVIC